MAEIYYYTAVLCCVSVFYDICYLKYITKSSFISSVDRQQTQLIKDEHQPSASTIGFNDVQRRTISPSGYVSSSRSTSIIGLPKISTLRTMLAVFNYLYMYTKFRVNRCSRAVVESGGPVESSRFSIAIVGDSRTRQIFNSLAHLLKDTNMTYFYKGKTGNIREIVPRLFDIHFHTNIRLVSHEIPLNITYYWDPLLDNWLPKLLKTWQKYPGTQPHLLQIGAGVHYLVFERKKAYTLFAQLWRKLLPSLSALANTTHTIVKMMDHVLVKYQKPSYASVLTDANINRMNKITSSLLLQHPPNNILVWNSSTPLSDQYVEYCYKEPKLTTKDSMWMCKDAMHLGYVVIHQLRDMMLNSFCNRY
ncbi:unnamed protein product, partial [Meganyctiphanes norvegica]